MTSTIAALRTIHAKCTTGKTTQNEHINIPFQFTSVINLSTWANDIYYFFFALLYVTFNSAQFICICFLLFVILLPTMQK